MKSVSETEAMSLACNIKIKYPHPDPGQKEKTNLKIIFTLLCGASKSFMKALKGPQGRAKIKI